MHWRDKWQIKYDNLNPYEPPYLENENVRRDHCNDCFRDAADGDSGIDLGLGEESEE